MSPLKLQDWVDGQLSALEATEIAAHVQGCDRCTRIVRWLRAVSEPLGLRAPLQAPTELARAALQTIAAAPPVQPITCGQAPECISAYLDEQLGEAEVAALEAHVFACEECFRLYVTQRALVHALRARQPEPAPEGLKARILEAVEEQSKQRVIGRIVWRKFALAAAGAAAAAGLLLRLTMQPAVVPMTEYVAQLPPVAAPQRTVQASRPPTSSLIVAPDVKSVTRLAISNPNRPAPQRTVRRSKAFVPASHSIPAQVDVPAQIAAVSAPAVVARMPRVRHDAPVAVPLSATAALPASWSHGSQVVASLPSSLESALPHGQPASRAVVPPKASPREMLIAQLPSSTEDAPRYIKRRAAATVIYRATVADAGDNIREANVRLGERVRDISSLPDTGVTLFR